MESVKIRIFGVHAYSTVGVKRDICHNFVAMDVRLKIYDTIPIDIKLPYQI